MNGEPLVARLAGGLKGPTDYVCNEWAEAVDAAFATIVIPPVLPPAKIAAKTAFLGVFRATLAAGFSPALQSGLTAYAAAFAAGTVPPGISTPPAAPLVIALPPTSPSLADSARLVAAAVVAWSSTGTYTAVPGVSPPVPWT